LASPASCSNRVFQHKNKLRPGFTARYSFDMLVYYEEFSQVASALTREKEIKAWRREKKLKLILAENPNWVDLSLEGKKILRGRPCLKSNSSGD